MKKKIISFLCVLCLAVTMCTTVFAAEGDTEKGNTKLSLTAALSADKAKIDVTISLTETTPIKGIQFDLAYEGEKVDPVETADVATNIFDSALTSFPKNVPDTCRYLGDNGTAITTTGRLVTFSFNVKAGVTGDISFNVNSLKVADKDAKPVECSITPSEVTVTIPTVQPTATPDPTVKPTATPDPTAKPTAEPTNKPTTEPTNKPTTEPTAKPTTEPTDKPTTEPTDKPTTEPTNKPTTTPGSSESSTSSQAPNATTNPDEAPSTGDTTNVTLYIVLALVCVAAMGGVVVYRRKVTH